MLSKGIGSLLAAAALFAAGTLGSGAATCSSDLQVDNFATFADALNSMKDATSDDQSMTSIAANNGILTFVTKDTNSYYYESFPCVQAKSQGYGGLQFTLTYPAGSQFTLEVQTKSSCNAESYQSEWFTIAGLTGTQQVITLDLDVYAGSNLDAIVGFVWAGFTVTGMYTMSDVKFVCGRLDAGTLEPPDLTPNSVTPLTPPSASPAPPAALPTQESPSALTTFTIPSSTASPLPPPPPPPPPPPASSSSSTSTSLSPPPPPPPPPPPSVPSSSSSSPSAPPASIPTSASSIISSVSSSAASSSSSSQLTMTAPPVTVTTTSTTTVAPTGTPPSRSSSISSSASASSTAAAPPPPPPPPGPPGPPGGPPPPPPPPPPASTRASETSSFFRAVSPTRPGPHETSGFATMVAPNVAPESSAEISVSMLVPRASLVPSGDSGDATTSTRRSVIRTTSTYRPRPTSLSECSDLLIDDWESQSRLTFLYYNSMMQASSDDGSMKSIVVNNDNTVTITPQNSDSYMYSQMGCVDVSDIYGGISMKVKAAAGTTFTIQLASSSNCGDKNVKTQSFTTRQLGWTFDGTLRSFSFPLDKYSSLDRSKMYQIYITGLSRAVTLGPMSFYCGDDATDYPAPPHPVNAQTQYQVSTPAGTAGTLLIDRFDGEDTNALGQWHGCEEDCVTFEYEESQVTLRTNDSDLAFYTAFADKCADVTAYAKSYLHIAYSGSNKFSIAISQANAACNPSQAPYPETWDSLEAARYASATDIYIPMSHFNVNLGRVINLVFKGFYTTATTTLKKVEFVNQPPSGWRMPNKLPSGNLVFGCKRPNSFAFAIDDGDPALAQEVMEIVRSENIKVTFFTVGLPLEDPSTNLSSVYRDMQSRGHQIALHSFTHPKMEGLPDYAAIDWEYNNDITAVSRTFDGMHTPYFRPPFGTEGARMRQRLAVALNVSDPYIVMWSVDVEDWRWGTSDTPEKQLDAFKRDINKGGNLVVMHYLYPNTVKYLRQFIQLAKATGRQLMRVDQCMMDPRAPPLTSDSRVPDSPIRGGRP